MAFLLIDQIGLFSNKELDVRCEVVDSLKFVDKKDWGQSIRVDVNEAYWWAFDNSIKGLQYSR